MKNRLKNQRTDIDEVIELSRLNYLLVVLLAVVLLFIPGCSQKNAPSKKPQASSDQKVKAPKEMSSIVSQIDQMIAALEQKKMISSRSVWQQKSKNGNQAGSTKSSGQSQDQSARNEKSGQNQQNQQSQSNSGSEEQTAGWQAEVAGIKKIHQNWNQLEPEAVKAGLGLEERDSFEKALEKLTLAIGAQKTDDSLKAAIELYGQYANLVNVFQSPVPPEFYKVKYELMAAAYEAGTKDWESAQKRTASINENWNHLKVKAKAEDEKLLSRTEYAIQDMILALQSKEVDILLVKTEIAMKNLQSLEKKLSSAQSSQSS